MEKEDRERLVRVETKLDLFLPHIKMVADHDKDISFVKRSLKGLWSLLGLAVLWFSGKQH